MKLVQWKQIEKNLKQDGKLTGSLELSGSFFLNNVDIVSQILNSGIFRQTGSYWATTNNLQVTGSFDIVLTGSSTFTITNESDDTLLYNQDGILIISPISSSPSPIVGGLMFSGSNEFFLGL